MALDEKRLAKMIADATVETKADPVGTMTVLRLANGWAVFDGHDDYGRRPFGLPSRTYIADGVSDLLEIVSDLAQRQQPDSRGRE